MAPRTKLISAVALAGALFGEPIAADISTTLAQPDPHLEIALIPDACPTTCNLLSVSGAAVTGSGAFYVAMTPVWTSGRKASFFLSVFGTIMNGDFGLDRMMSMLGRFIPHNRMRAIRAGLLAGEPQVVAGQRKGKSAAPTPLSGTPTPITTTEQASAHEAVMHFLQGIKIAALPEGKRLLADTQWILGDADRGENFYSRPDYSDVSSIFATLFDTDFPTIKGYKELFDMKAVTQAGTIANIKFMVIAFKDRTTGTWKVLDSMDNLGDESVIDVDRQVAYFKSHLADTRYESARERYATYGHWLLLAGRLAEARTALTAARTAPYESTGLPDSLRDKDDPIRNLQISVLLTVIDRITSSLKVVQ